MNDLENELAKLTGSTQEPWRAAVLALVAQGMEKHGLDGFQKVSVLLASLMNNKTVSLEWVDLKTASDLLAHMQNAEADKKLAVNAFLSQLGMILGKIAGGALKGLL